jgi:hypothetical protein
VQQAGWTALTPLQVRRRLQEPPQGKGRAGQVRHARAAAQARRATEATRITFAQYAVDYLAWCRQPDASGQVRKRSWRTIKSELSRLLPAFGPKCLHEITTAEVERFRDALLSEMTQATANRYRDRLSAMLDRAIRLGLVASNRGAGPFDASLL